MAGRNYFVPSVDILILLFIICIVVFIRERKLSTFLIIIPGIIVVLSYSPLVIGNPKLETAMLILAFITGSIVYRLDLKGKGNKR